MNPALIIPTLKLIGVAILLGLVGYIVWDINSTYNERTKLEKISATQQASIEVLKDDIKLHKELNESLTKRKQELEIVEIEYKKFLESNKKSNKKFIDNSKKEIENIRKKDPNKLDKHYINKYNLILDCIRDTTVNKETKCDIL
jgi:hypothetical protein